jgi:hypothetical protein
MKAGDPGPSLYPGAFSFGVGIYGCDGVVNHFEQAGYVLVVHKTDPPHQ